MSLRRDDRLIAAVTIAVVALDQLTKAWALRSFADGPTHVVWTLELVVAHNTGAAFSLGSGRGAGPVIGLLAVVVIAVIARSMRGVGGRSTTVAIGMVVGGAIGNLVDRAFRSNNGFMHGAVVDWINFQWWPVFNVADAAIVVGAIALAIRAAFAPAPVEETPADADQSEGEDA